MTSDSRIQRAHQGPLRRMLSALFAITQTRLEVMAIELAEEKERLLAVLFLGLASMLLGLMSLVTLSVLIAIAFWDNYRWQALAVLTLIYIAAAVICALKARSLARGAPMMFNATIDEFKRDSDLFKH